MMQKLGLLSRRIKNHTHQAECTVWVDFDRKSCPLAGPSEVILALRSLPLVLSKAGWVSATFGPLVDLIYGHFHRSRSRG